MPGCPHSSRALLYRVGGGSAGASPHTGRPHGAAPRPRGPPGGEGAFLQPGQEKGNRALNPPAFGELAWWALRPCEAPLALPALRPGVAEHASSPRRGRVLEERTSRFPSRELANRGDVRGWLPLHHGPCRSARGVRAACWCVSSPWGRGVVGATSPDPCPRRARPPVRGANSSSRGRTHASSPRMVISILGGREGRATAPRSGLPRLRSKKVTRSALRGG